MCKKLIIEELKFLKSLYNVHFPKFVPTLGLLAQFIERFEKHPEWQQKVDFVTINEESLKCGTFLMTYCNYIVLFNSLEPAPYGNLEKLLNKLDFTTEKKFWSIEEHHADVVYRIAKSQGLHNTFDESSKCTLHIFTEEDLKMGLELFTNQPGFYYDSLKQSDVPRMTEISLYKLPSWYFENVIQYNITTGLYTNSGELVAWTGMHEVGESGLTNVAANYRRQRLATGVITKQASKVFGTGKLIFGHVFDNNPAAMELFTNINRLQIAGNHKWINLIKTESAKKCQL